LYPCGAVLFKPITFGHFPTKTTAPDYTIAIIRKALLVNDSYTVKSVATVTLMIHKPYSVTDFIQVYNFFSPVRF
jgi:hypothetical protein